MVSAGHSVIVSFRQAETFAKDDYRTPSPDTQVAVEEKSNLKELLPDLPLAKFFALGAQLVVIEGLASQDLRFKVCHSQTPTDMAQNMVPRCCNHTFRPTCKIAGRATTRCQ